MIAPAASARPPSSSICNKSSGLTVHTGWEMTAASQLCLPVPICRQGYVLPAPILHLLVRRYHVLSHCRAGDFGVCGRRSALFG